MFAIISLGAVPLLEYSISQVVPNPDKAYEECNRLIALLRFKFGYEPLGVKFLIVSPPIPYPSCYIVEYHFDNEDFKAVQYLLRVKMDFPTTWDDALPKFACLN